MQADDLRNNLSRIDGRGYKAYKDIRGRYDFQRCTLFIDYVQGDPFAAPSKVRLRVAQKRAAIPSELFQSPVRRIALQDTLARQVRRAIRQVAEGVRGSGKSGAVSIDAGAQEVLERTACVVTPEWAEARLEVGLPASGRRILGRQAAALLCDELPRIAALGLEHEHLDDRAIRRFVTCVENQAHIRSRLAQMGLVAFIADGSILPRQSGASDQPLDNDAVVPFRSPDSLRVEIELPNPLPDGSCFIRGMGVPRGVTLIVGGGYHGKSTVLDALQRGVYPHIPGDGREYVVTTPDAVKIRAEDGRRVETVDISPFITNLPQRRSTEAFRSDDASGSTSQAANIVEALEVGATALLLDEDTSATNFMVRDARMQALVQKQHEPITPFVERVAELHERLGTSTILVMGGCGDYFDVADTVILMREFLPYDVTAEAKQVAERLQSNRRHETDRPLSALVHRIPEAGSFDPSRGRRDVKIDAKALDRILYGREPIDLRFVEQLVDYSQTRAVGYAIHLTASRFMDGKRVLREVLNDLDNLLDEEGLGELAPFARPGEHPGNLARPRRFEIAAAINRLRTVRMHSHTA